MTCHVCVLPRTMWVWQSRSVVVICVTCLNGVRSKSAQPKWRGRLRNMELLPLHTNVISVAKFTHSLFAYIDKRNHFTLKGACSWTVAGEKPQLVKSATQWRDVHTACHCWSVLFVEQMTATDGSFIPYTYYMFGHCSVSGYCDGTGVQRRHCQSHDDKAAAVSLENRPHHCGSDEQGQSQLFSFFELRQNLTFCIVLYVHCGPTVPFMLRFQRRASSVFTTSCLRSAWTCRTLSPSWRPSWICATRRGSSPNSCEMPFPPG